MSRMSSHGTSGIAALISCGRRFAASAILPTTASPANRSRRSSSHAARPRRTSSSEAPAASFDVVEDRIDRSLGAQSGTASARIVRSSRSRRPPEVTRSTSTPSTVCSSRGGGPDRAAWIPVPCRRGDRRPRSRCLGRGPRSRTPERCALDTWPRSPRSRRACSRGVVRAGRPMRSRPTGARRASSRSPPRPARASTRSAPCPRPRTRRSWAGTCRPAEPARPA
jgi:hypothetical protein